MTTQSTAYRKLYRHDTLHWRARRIDGGPVREHVNSLLAAGWTQGAISDAAGVGATTVNGIVAGRVDRPLTATGRALLAVTEDALRARPDRAGLVIRVGAQRRIRALLAVGHTHDVITAAMRAARPQVRTRSHLLLSQRGGWITGDTFDAVAGAYDALAMMPGASAKTRARAAAASYAPPLAWDDDEIDDPNSAPVAVPSSSPWDPQPCGTAAAARRHHRRGERLDEACTAAQRRASAERRAGVAA